MLDKIRSDQSLPLILNLLTGHTPGLYHKQSNINTFTLPGELRIERTIFTDCS